jgi:protocatechuate 4,5-dioxygenase, alpha chain
MNSQWEEIKDLSDIPGTTVFTGEMARIGFHLNQFCMSLMKCDNRERFKLNEAEYLHQWPLTPEQISAVLRRDYAAMMALGGNVYFLAKIGATDGWPFIRVAATMSGLSEEEYRNMMNSGGRSVEGLRSARELR